MTLFRLATRLRELGLSFLPIPAGNNKRPPAGWKWGHLKNGPPSVREIEAWYGGPAPAYGGIALIAGVVSGGGRAGRVLECIDLDDGPAADEFLALTPQETLEKLVPVRTPRLPAGGLHLWYWYELAEGELPDGSTELALRPKTEAELEADRARGVKTPNPNKTLIETRGEGGYALVPGCLPGVHPDGGTYEFTTARTFDNLTTIDHATRALLWGTARAMDRLAVRPAVEWRNDGAGLYTRNTPMNDFDVRGSWQRFLEPLGWRLVLGSWDRGYLARPGKEGRAVGASLGVCRGSKGEGLLRVFSTNAPMPTGAYGKARAWAFLTHKGDLRAATQALGQMGFGEPARKPGTKPRFTDPETNGAVHETNGTHHETNGTGNGTPAITLAQFDPFAGRTLAELAAAQLVKRKAVIEGLVYPGLNLLAGMPKMGKSFLLLLYAWAVATGQDLYGRKVDRGDVLFLDLEEQEEDLQERAHGLGPVLKWDFASGVHLRYEWPRPKQGGFHYLREYLTARPATKMVVIDTLAKFWEPEKRGGGNAYQAEYDQLGEFKKLCADFNVAIVVNHHLTKLQITDDPFAAISGTAAVMGAPDVLTVLDRARDSAEGKLFTTGRVCRSSTIYGTIAEENGLWDLSDFTAGIDVSGQASGKVTKLVDGCIAFVRNKLRYFAHPIHEVQDEARKAGFEFGVYDAAIQKIGRKGSGEVFMHDYGRGNEPDWWIGKGPWRAWIQRVKADPDAPAIEEAPAAPGAGPDFWGA